MKFTSDLLTALAANNTLISFSSVDPNAASVTTVTGVTGTLLGIDTRPSNGLVYGITTTNNIYTIDTASGAATLISTLDTPFEGSTVSGFDFNPVADRLRLVGGNDQDFRINVDTGEVTIDGDLAFAPGDVNAGADPSVTAAAYTNAIAAPSTTQLYDIDAELDTLVLQDPPNDGTLVTIGDLGIDFDTVGGFDIVSAAEGNNTAFAVSDATLYSIDLQTGAATNLGAIGPAGGLDILGLTSTADNLTPPTAAGTQFAALTDDNVLQIFDGGSPDAVASFNVTGLDGDLLGIDVRPSNGLVYGITTNNSIYTIDPTSGAATFVSTLNVPFEGGTVSGFDFNPVADRLRLVGGNDQDFRINVDTGEVTVDGDLAFAAGDANAGVDPAVTGAAYTNAIAAPSTTLLYDIDAELDTLLLQDPPNDGTLLTVGALGVDFDGASGFDIVTAEEGNNAAFAVSNSVLYGIDLETGAATALGTIGDGTSTGLIGFTALPTVASPATGTLGDDTITGTDGDDILRGNNGNDIIFGLGGDDTIFGGRDDDDISGGTGDDDLRGLAGDDIIAGNAGSDRIRGNGGADIMIGNAGEDNMLGGSGSDEMRGGADADVVRGAKDDDIIFGGSGSDIIRGGKGNDMLFGNAGSDILRADGGDDLLDGGRGDDEIRTGAGNDIVVLAADDGTDTIFRFKREGDDQIQLEGISFGQISLTVDGGDTTIGFGGQTLAIVVNVDSLTQADFIFSAA